MKTVREAYSVFYQAIQVRSADFGVVQRMDGTVRQIIGDEKEKVRASALPRRSGKCSCAEGDRLEKATPIHLLFTLEDQFKTKLNLARGADRRTHNAKGRRSEIRIRDSERCGVR